MLNKINKIQYKVGIRKSSSLLVYLNKTICCQIMKVLGPTITDNVFVIRSRKKMASLEHFKCASPENVTSSFIGTETASQRGMRRKVVTEIPETNIHLTQGIKAKMQPSYASIAALVSVVILLSLVKRQDPNNYFRSYFSPFL